MHRKALVCRRDVFFLLKILSFGKKCDEVVQMKSRGIRKAIFCETLTYSERAESQLSPKVSLTTICDLHLLLRVPDREEGILLHFGEVDVNFVAISISGQPRSRTVCSSGGVITLDTCCK